MPDRPRRTAPSVFLSLTIAGILAGLALTAGGCATSGRSASQRMGASSLDSVELRRLGYATRWIYQTASARGGNGITFASVNDDTLLLIEGDDNMVTSVDARDGSFRWKAKVGPDMVRLAGATLYRDSVFVVSNDRVFQLDANTGGDIAYASLPQPVNTPAARSGGFAVYGGANGLIFGMDLQTFLPRWRYRFAGRIAAQPLIVDDTAYVADAVGNYGAFALTTGSLAYRNRVFGAVHATPTAHADLLLLPSADRTLYALDRATGRDRWTYRTEAPLKESAVSAGDLILLRVPGRGLVALDADGGERWTADADFKPIGAAGADCLVYDAQGLKRLDPADGRVIAAASVQRPVRMIDAGNGSLILEQANGQLVRLDPIRR